MFDKDILERILGRHSVLLRGWVRSPCTSTQTDASKSSSDHHSYADLLIELNDMKNRLHEVVEVLRVQDIMPPAPLTYVSDLSSSLPSDSILGIVHLAYLLSPFLIPSLLLSLSSILTRSPMILVSSCYFSSSMIRLISFMGTLYVSSILLCLD